MNIIATQIKRASAYISLVQQGTFSVYDPQKPLQFTEVLAAANQTFHAVKNRIGGL